MMLVTLNSPACHGPMARKQRTRSSAGVITRSPSQSSFFSFAELRSQSPSMLQPDRPLFVPWTRRGQRTLGHLLLLFCLENLSFRALSKGLLVITHITPFLKLTSSSHLPVFLVFPQQLSLFEIIFLVGMSLIIFLMECQFLKVKDLVARTISIQ